MIISQAEVAVFSSGMHLASKVISLARAGSWDFMLFYKTQDLLGIVR